MLASVCGNQSIVDCVTEYFRLPEVRDMLDAALILAVYNQHFTIAETLLRSGADPSAFNHELFKSSYLTPPMIGLLVSHSFSATGYRYYWDCEFGAGYIKFIYGGETNFSTLSKYNIYCTDLDKLNYEFIQTFE
jgi:hypothetical protein